MKTTPLTMAVGAFALSGIANASDDHAAVTQPMKIGDGRMSCDQLLAEAQGMETILGGSPANNLMDSEAMANVGTGIAQQAALRSGAGQAAGAIGAVGGLLGKRAKMKKEEEMRIQTIAEKRWIYVVGLYQGRDCDSVTVSPTEGAPATE